MLAAYAQVPPSNDTLQIWIGLFDDAAPVQPSILIDEIERNVQVVDGLSPIRDGMVDDSAQPVNHRTIVRITGLAPGTSYLVTVRGGGGERSFKTSTLPNTLPTQLDGWFNIFLCSCYFQPEDASGTLSNVITKILMRPNLTLMMGDQIYGDLPLDVDLPGGQTIEGMLGSKYMRNFASRALETGGLTRILQRAPAMCVADDHEYWNNYPFGQVQLPNTWAKRGRTDWEVAARRLYEDYQLGAGVAPGFARRLTIDPLKMLVVDMRSDRDQAFSKLMSNQAKGEFEAWAAELLADRANGLPAFGLLCSGQALFAAPTEESKRKREDAEMSNWEQFDTLIVPTLERLADAGIPVIYVTGDVHWGRVAQAKSPLRDSQPMIYEVITSPSTLIRVPVVDRAKETWEGLKGLFGERKRWPRHSPPADVPQRLGASTRFQLESRVTTRQDMGYQRQGDQVAMLSLCRSGAGIDFRVTYFEVSDESSGAAPDQTRIYSMRNL